MATNITCPSCKKQIEQRYQVNRYVGCTKCQTLVKVKDGHVTEISRKRNTSLYGSDLQLGDKVKLDGILFNVVAQFRYSEHIKEFVKEEGRYYSSPWKSDEWYLMNDDHLSAWLCTDDEGLYRVTYFTPETPMLPDSDNFLTLEGGTSMYRAMEHGQRTLDAFVGEFPSYPKRGLTINFAMYEMHGENVEVEWYKTGGKVEWVSFNKSKYVSWDDQKIMFSANGADRKKNRSLRLVDTTKLAQYLLVFTAVIFGLAAGITSGEGNEHFAYAKNFSLNDPSTLSFATPVFEFAESGDLYSLDVSASFEPTDNSELEFGIKVLDANTEKVVNAIEGVFFMESGRDSEGYWTEVVASDSELFKVKDPGKYFAVVTIYNSSSARTGTFNFRIVEQMLSRYYLIGLVLSIGLLYLIYETNKKSNR